MNHGIFEVCWSAPFLTPYNTPINSPSIHLPLGGKTRGWRETCLKPREYVEKTRVLTTMRITPKELMQGLKSYRVNAVESTLGVQRKGNRDHSSDACVNLRLVFSSYVDVIGVLV